MIAMGHMKTPYNTDNMALYFWYALTIPLHLKKKKMFSHLL